MRHTHCIERVSVLRVIIEIRVGVDLTLSTISHLLPNLFLVKGASKSRLLCGESPVAQIGWTTELSTVQIKEVDRYSS